MGKYVEVYGDKIPVVVSHLDEDNGTYSYHRDQIELSDTLKKCKINEILLHEMVHAALNKSGLSEILGDKTEESVCVAIQNGLKNSVKVLLCKEDDRE